MQRDEQIGRTRSIKFCRNGNLVAKLAKDSSPTICSDSVPERGALGGWCNDLDLHPEFR